MDNEIQCQSSVNGCFHGKNFGYSPVTQAKCQCWLGRIKIIPIFNINSDVQTVNFTEYAPAPSLGPLWVIVKKPMKQTILIIVTLLFGSCSVTSNLNKQINQSQKASLKNSPFETAMGMKSELKMQIKYRIQYDDELKTIIGKNQNDTIVLTENYDFICVGCPADYVNIFVRNKLISYQKILPKRHINGQKN
ncbi:MAG: hypothetical protein IPN18_16445 [Ignavibacteriales bacterium]|nr:hypothetical protein [Ignavibacteriales bacterium]